MCGLVQDEGRSGSNPATPTKKTRFRFESPLVFSKSHSAAIPQVNSLSTPSALADPTVDGPNSGGPRCRVRLCDRPVAPIITVCFVIPPPSNNRTTLFRTVRAGRSGHIAALRSSRFAQPRRTSIILREIISCCCRRWPLRSLLRVM